jgi:hypothetical protein
MTSQQGIELAQAIMFMLGLLLAPAILLALLAASPLIILIAILFN